MEKKKVLLRERKRHTARRVAVAIACYSRGGCLGTPPKMGWGTPPEIGWGTPPYKVGVPPVQGWIRYPRPRLDWVPPRSRLDRVPPL